MELNNQKKFFVVIPAYNEAKTIGQVVKNVKLYTENVIVVNDNSTDGTQAAAESAGAIVLKHEINQGYDGAINSGFSEAYKRGADVFITFDADGQHKHEDLGEIIGLMTNGGLDMVIAQRSQIAHFCEKIFAAYTNLFFGIKDPLCGLKAYTREVYESVGFFDGLKSIGTQLMLEAMARGFKKVKLIPITLNSRQDESRFYSKKIKANLKIFKAMVRVMMRILAVKVAKKHPVN